MFVQKEYDENDGEYEGNARWNARNEIKKGLKV